ncbi:hypothetical protein N332_11933, partial [Mesitornis unicolor]
MALRFRNIIPYAIPGVLALLGCWWICFHRKKQASYQDKQATAIEEKQQEEESENASSPKTEACIPQRRPLSSEEECPENKTSTSLLPVGSTTPSRPCQTPERPDLSQDLPDLSVMTTQPSTLEDDSEKLETIGSQDESSIPARVSLTSKSAECHGSAALSLVQESSSSANQDQWPPASVTLRQKSLGIAEISNVEQSGDSSCKPPEESQKPETVLSDASSVTAHCLGLDREANTPQVFLNNEVEVLSSHKGSAISVLPDSLESARLEQSREEEMSNSIASTVPVCQEEDTQPKGDELEREKTEGVSLDKEEVEKIEQVAIQIISKVILAATEEVLSGSASDVSTWICQAAAGRVERPLEMANVVSSDQMLAEKAMGADENTAVKNGSAVLTSPQTEERDHSVADCSCVTHVCLSSPVQGDAQDRRVKNHVRSRGVERTLVENHGGSLEKSPRVMEDSGCSTYTSEGGTSVEDSLQNTMLSVTSSQHSDSLSASATQDTSAEQSSAPSEKSPSLKLPEASKVPYSNGILGEDSPDLHHECSRAAGMDGDTLGGKGFKNASTKD